MASQVPRVPRAPSIKGTKHQVVKIKVPKSPLRLPRPFQSQAVREKIFYNFMVKLNPFIRKLIAV